MRLNVAQELFSKSILAVQRKHLVGYFTLGTERFTRLDIREKRMYKPEKISVFIRLLLIASLCYRRIANS